VAVAENHAGLLRVAEVGGGRVLRYSGTELKDRQFIEARYQSMLDKWSKQICEAIKRQVGA